MTRLSQYISKIEVLNTLEPEALAGILLSMLKKRDKFLFYNEWLQIQQDFNWNHDTKMIISAAWQYLRSECLIGPSPDQDGWEIVTKRGHHINDSEGIDDLSRRTLLKKQLLHASLQSTTFSQFLSGNYELSVIQAYKEVEICVRDKSQLKSLNGVNLMRSAFKPKSGRGINPGPLTDTNLDVSEQEGMMNIFAGAMGWCRNPVHHKTIEMSLDEAMQMISFASYLLSLVDKSDCVPSRLKTLPKKK